MLRRRLATVPAASIAFGVVTCALPALVVAALLVDLVRPARRGSFVAVRLALFLEAFLFTEVLGLVLLAAVGIASLGSRSRREALTWPVQRFYTGTLMAAVRALFAIRVEIEGAELAARGGPVLVMIRHASVVDVLLPAILLANPHRLRLRYVLKRELLLDPCMDIAGHFLPNRFVARNGESSQEEIQAVRALKDGIGAGDGVLVYPEGTRFTEEKRRRALERLRGDPAALARAERLRHVLPVRPGGPLALLDAEPACDVLFIAHHGLEATATVADAWSGALVGGTIRVKLWREPGASLPRGSGARLEWLTARWERLDDWLASAHDAGAARAEERRMLLETR
jgi:1-acyl-sn-glycerol-3-phosphate acyltransferase